MKNYSNSAEKVVASIIKENFKQNVDADVVKAVAAKLTRITAKTKRPSNSARKTRIETNYADAD